MKLSMKLRNAAEHPDDWDVRGLLRDAACHLDNMLAALKDHILFEAEDNTESPERAARYFAMMRGTFESVAKAEANE